jgi:charged multivesicular body protein 6
MGGAFSSAGGSGSASSKNKQQSLQASRRAEISDIDRAVLDLKNARDRLTRYRNKLQTDSDKLVEQARKAKLKGRNETALGLLRLRKYKSQQADAVDGQLLTVLQMVETIDSKQNEKQVLDALASGKDALKLMHEQTTVDDVLNLFDEIKEELEVEREITEILQGVPTLSPADEAAVEEELERMEAEMNGTKVDEAAAAAAELPAVPTTKLPDLPTTEAIASSNAAAATATAAKPERVAVPG